MVADPADNAVRLGEGSNFKPIEYPPGTTQHTKDRIEAVAWATYRRGHAKWEGNNLPNQIASYLTHLGYPMSNEDARYVMEWVSKQGIGYATLAKVGEGKRSRYVEFNFFRNYDISKCSAHNLLNYKGKVKTPVNMNGKGVSAAEVDKGVAQVLPESAQHVDPIDHLKQRAAEEKAKQTEAAKPVLTPPMPFEPPKPRPYLLDQLNDLLTDWADADPEAYAKWVEGVIESFQYRA